MNLDVPAMAAIVAGVIAACLLILGGTNRKRKQ